MSPAEQLRFVAAVQRLMVNKDYLLGACGSVFGSFVIKRGHGCGIWKFSIPTTRLLS